MSEKRFSKVWITEDGDIAITDDGVDLIFTGDAFLIFLNELAEKEATINQLKEENERLKNKLNVTALELVDEAISMGKAVEISEMNYHEFLEYRQKKGKSMELQR